jgi:hypothetical protein
MRFLLTACVITANNFSIAQSSIHNQYDYALKLFEQDQYYLAITEFKRLLYFDSLKQYSFPANKFIGLCYKHGGKLNDAVKYLSLAELETSNIDSLFEIKIEIVKTNLLRRTIYRVFDLLKVMSNDERFGHKKNDIVYWTGWAFIFNDEWEKASDEFAKLDSNHDLMKLCKNVSDEHYSKTKAKILSYILPGAGQFYTGNYFSGLLSLGWVALWTYTSVQAFLDNRIFDGFMVADFLALRFYNGNLQNAEKFAEEHNKEASNCMLQYLQRNYLGQKP